MWLHAPEHCLQRTDTALHGTGRRILSCSGWEKHTALMGRGWQDACQQGSVPGKKKIISLIGNSKSSSDKWRAGTAGIREQYHTSITFPASSAVQSQHRKASRRQWRPTGLCQQSLRSCTPANKGERTVLDSQVLLTPGPSARLMTRPLPAAITTSLPFLFVI